LHTGDLHAFTRQKTIPTSDRPRFEELVKGHEELLDVIGRL
jgi:hypothetical protein